MEFRTLGKTGTLVSTLCLGTMMFGRRCDEAEARRIVDAALERGVDNVDTAAAYADGATEEILGRHVSVFYRDEDVRLGMPNRDLAIAVADGHLQDEAWRIRKDGSLFWASVVLTSLRDGDGRMVGCGVVMRDLT